MNKYDKQTIELPLGWMLEQCNDWDNLCAELGLNPWLLNEGIADGEDKHPITISQAKKHGLLTEELEKELAEVRAELAAAREVIKSVATWSQEAQDLIPDKETAIMMWRGCVGEAAHFLSTPSSADKVQAVLEAASVEEKRHRKREHSFLCRGEEPHHRCTCRPKLVYCDCLTCQSVRALRKNNS